MAYMSVWSANPNLFTRYIGKLRLLSKSRSCTCSMTMLSPEWVLLHARSGMLALVFFFVAAECVSVCVGVLHCAFYFRQVRAYGSIRSS